MKKLTTVVFTVLVYVCSPIIAAETATRSITQVDFSAELASGGDLILGIYSNGNLGRYGDHLDERSDGLLAHAVKAIRFEAEAASTRVIAGPQGSGFDQILLIGLGEEDETKTDLEWQQLGGDAVQSGIDALQGSPVLAFDVSPEAAAHIAYGAKLGSYYFDNYFSDDDRKKSQQALTVVTPEAVQSESIFLAQLNPVANAIWLTRDVSNEPGNVIYPENFVQQWKAHFKGMENVSVRVYDERDLLKNGMGAFYGVGQGSEFPPRMIVVEYMGGEKDESPVVVVGKGVTFDSGGISIKPWKNMWNMKFDMSGAASAMGTLSAVAGRGAKANVVAIAGLAENMPDGNAQRPGDIVTSMSGKTIEVRQTDAEGRLVLADAVHYADVTYNPALLVDLATLTGSAVRALGKDYAALFTRHDELVEDFVAMGEQTGDEVWYMPLNDNHFKIMESNVADLVNLGAKGPGASTGAAFVGSFVRESTHWVHLDIAGVAYSDTPTSTKSSPGSAAFAVRLLNGYIKTHFEK